MTTASPTPVPAAGEATRIPFYWWPFWMLLLAACLFVFYVLFTPVWIGIRLAARLSDRRSRGT